MAYEFPDFTISDMAGCSTRLRSLGEGSPTMEETAQGVVNFFFREFRSTDDTEPPLVLARLFKTHPFGLLPPDLQAVALQTAKGEPRSTTPCLTLLGTAGVALDWNDRHRSATHRAIPLLDPDMVARTPMIAALIQQLGMEVQEVLERYTRPQDLSGAESFDVFFVPQAEGSPLIPAQSEFVRPYGVRSVLGVGGLLSEGSLFVLLLFSRKPIPRATAELFRPLAVALKAALIDTESRVFARPELGHEHP